MKRGEITPERIAEIRNTLGLSQREFAEYLGVSKGIVFRWEHGTASPRRKAILERLTEVSGRRFPLYG